MVELTKRMEQREEADRETLITADLRLVIYVPKRYRQRGLPLLDLIPYANLGPMQAVERFDYRQEATFSTYATWSIRPTMTRGLADTGRTIRYPYHLHEYMGRLRRNWESLEQNNGSIRIDDLVHAFGLPGSIVRVPMTLHEPLAFLDQPLGLYEDIWLEELLAGETIPDPAEAACIAVLCGILGVALAKLKPWDAFVVRERFGLNPEGIPYALIAVGAASASIGNGCGNWGFEDYASCGSRRSYSICTRPGGPINFPHLTPSDAMSGARLAWAAPRPPAK